jgi:hypothetical protein
VTVDEFGTNVSKVLFVNAIDSGAGVVVATNVIVVT